MFADDSGSPRRAPAQLDAKTGDEKTGIGKTNSGRFIDFESGRDLIEHAGFNFDNVDRESSRAGSSSLRVLLALSPRAGRHDLPCKKKERGIRPVSDSDLSTHLSILTIAPTHAKCHVASQAAGTAENSRHRFLFQAAGSGVITANETQESQDRQKVRSSNCVPAVVWNCWRGNS